MKENEYEIIIIGGSYSGLSAAMALGRSLRRTLIIDNGAPCNQQTPHSHNFLTQDGKTPTEISTLGRQQVEQYQTVAFLDDWAATSEMTGAGFAITTQSGKVFSSSKLIVASGIKDQKPAIHGFSECWGISVVHCPYCHGYEFRGQKTAIFANGERAFHLSGLVNNLTSDLTILTNGKADFTADQLNNLRYRNIQVTETAITEFKHEKGHVKSVILNDGKIKEFSAVYAAIPFVQHSDIPRSLGCELTPQGHIKIDATYHTTVPGIFACGDNSSPLRSVANAVAAGNYVGAVVNKELTTEQFQLPE
ncbi:MAG: NAD(P)/FAD-dependent oxidoreductase [Chryseolinea sp.]